MRKPGPFPKTIMQAKVVIEQTQSINDCAYFIHAYLLLTIPYPCQLDAVTENDYWHVERSRGTSIIHPKLERSWASSDTIN